MYVIFPAEEVVYFTYEAVSARRVTLERPVPAAARAPPPAEKARTKLLKKLGKPNYADFGRITRSPDPVDFELPAPLPTPAFSRKNIFDRDFDALFEVSNAPQFSENVRVVTPEPRRRHDVTAASFRAPSLPPSPRTSLASEQRSSLISEPRASLISEPRVSLILEQRRSPTPPPPPSPRRPPSRQHSKDSMAPTEEHSSANSSCRSKKVSFFRRLSRAVAVGAAGGAAGNEMAGEAVLRDLAHPAYNEQLKNHNNGSFKLVKTVSDFTTQLSQIYEQHSSELAALVAAFRKRNAELRKERTSCPSSLFHTWETLLQEVEADSVGAGTAASALDRQVARPLVEKTFHMKLQSRKLFAHRDGCEAILVKAEEKLTKSRADYKNAHATYVTAPSPGALGAYYDAHNAYVQQLAATNGMLDQYHRYTLPTILQELEEIYGDLCNTLTDAIYQESEVITSKCNEQFRRYESLGVQSRAVSSTADLAHLARAISTAAPPAQRALRRAYVPPVEADAQPEAENQPPSLKNEVILDRVGAQQARLSYETLKKDAVDLELQIKQLQDSLDALARIQARSLEGSLYNKVNEIQEDISMKKYDYRAAQLHLSAIRAQKELFAARADGNVADRKLSSSSTGSMKNKWLKAFRSLKPAPSPQPPPVTGQEKRNGNSGRDNARVAGETDAHNFQEYTYKKITPCDVCSQVLRGHTRQGLRCRLCKMNVHVDCMSSVGKCQTKSRLLRRQKSTSEIESRIQDNVLEEERIDEGWLPGQRLRRLSFKDYPEYNYEAGRSPYDMGVRRRLFAGMKSFSVFGSRSRNNSPQHRSISLPESTMRNSSSAFYLRLPQWSDQLSTSPGTYRNNCMRPSFSRSLLEHERSKSTPSSPVHNRRLLSAKTGRVSSVELPDEHDKSLSSASTSPCPSPVKQNIKQHRLLPTNLYVVLYNFKSRHQDELDLKAGYKVTVIDTSDQNWWKGKCLGKIGYFPSKYCTKLQAGEKPLQVTHNLQVSDGDNGLMLLRDQIVIQVGDEVDGMVMIRSGDNRQGVCPIKFLQEV